MSNTILSYTGKVGLDNFVFGKNRLATLISGCTFTILGGKRQSGGPSIHSGRWEETYPRIVQQLTRQYSGKLTH